MAYLTAETSRTVADRTATPVMVAARIMGSTERGSAAPRRSAAWARRHSRYAVTDMPAPSTISGTPRTCRAPRNAGKRWQQLDDAQAGHNQRERGPVPGQEGALVGQGEPGIWFDPATGCGLRRAGLPGFVLPGTLLFEVVLTVAAARRSSTGTVTCSPPCTYYAPW